MSKDSSDKSAVSPSIPRVPWSPLWGLIFAVIIYYAAQIIAGALLLSVPFISHQTRAQAINWLDNSVAAQFIFILLTEVLMVGSIFAFLKLYKFSLSGIGLKKPKFEDLIYGLAAVPFYFVFYLVTVGLISHFVPNLDINQTQELGFDNVYGFWPMVMTFVSLVVLPPIAEEIMVRGFIYSTFKKALPAIWAVLLTSALFAVAHLPEGGAAGPLYIAAIDTFVLSLILIYLREQTGSLWASITLHAMKNGIAFAALFVFHIK